MMIYVIRVWFTQWFCKLWLSQLKPRNKTTNKERHTVLVFVCVCASVGTNSRAAAQDRPSPDQNTAFHIFNETPCGPAVAAGATVGDGKNLPLSFLRLHSESDTSASRSGRLQKVRGLWPQNKNPAVSRSGEETGCVWESEDLHKLDCHMRWK